jgi:hypothetical protein
MNRLEKIQDYINSLQEVYDTYRRELTTPDGKITIQLTDEQIQLLTDVFIDAIHKAAMKNERERVLKYEALHEHIHLQIMIGL